jgi:N6-L-threonylcarbamoyladenine synthase
LSGLKAAVSRYLGATENPVLPDVAASFVQAVMDILIKKSRLAIAKNPCVSFVVVGGVAASPQLRAEATKLCEKMGVELCLPPVKWSTDNAAMIALATWDYINTNTLIKPLPQLQLPITEF